MKNKLSILIMIFLVFILVSSVFVSAVDLRPYHWVGLGNEKSITEAEAETMYVNTDGDLVYTKGKIQKKYSQWRVEEDDGTEYMQVWVGSWGGWQYFEYDDSGDNMDYASFVRVVNQNKNKYADSMFKDSVPGYSTPVTVTDNIKSDGNAKYFGPEKKKRDEQLKKTTEATARAKTATTGAATASASAKDNAKLYQYDTAISGLNTAITELEKAEEQAKKAGLTSEAAKLKKQREKLAALKDTYNKRKTDEAALGAPKEIAERDALAKDVARLEQEIAEARAAKNNAEVRRLTKEKQELEKILKQEADIVRLLIEAEAEDDPDRKKSLDRQIQAKRNALAADKAYQKQIDDARDKILAATKDPRMNEKWQALKKSGKDKNLAALKKVLAEHELEQKASMGYGISLEGKTHSQIKSELAKREKIKKDALEAGLTDTEYGDVVRAARGSATPWDAKIFEAEIYKKLANRYGVDRVGKTPLQIKNEVNKRRKTIDKSVKAMVKNGANEAEARAALMEKAKETKDPKKFEAAAKDLEEREKVRQEIKKFQDAIDAAELPEAQKLDLKEKFDAALEKKTGAEARAEFDRQRVAMLKNLKTSDAEAISKAYAGVAPPPAARLRPADLGYYDGLDAKIDEELKKPLPDYAKINAWKKEKEEFEAKYKKYRENYIKLTGSDAGVKGFSVFQSIGEFDQEAKVISVRSTAKTMGLAPDQTKGKTLAEVTQMMDTRSKSVLQAKINSIDPNTKQATLALTDSEVAALGYQAATGGDQAASQALALLIAGGKKDEAKKLLSDNPDLAQKNPELVEYLANLDKAGAQGVYDDEKINFIKAIRTGKYKQVAGQINTLVKEGATNIFNNVGKKGTRYEGWTKVDSWVNPETGKTTALVKDPKTGNYYVITEGSTQRNEDMYRVPKGKFKDEEGKQREYASPYVYYNALREGTALTPTPDEISRQNQVSDLKLIHDGNMIYNGKIEDDKEIGYVAEIGKEDSDIAVFMRPNKHDGDELKAKLKPFGAGLGFGKFSIGDEMYVNKDGAVYNKEEEAIESSLLYTRTKQPDGTYTGDIALANYNIDLGSNVRVYTTASIDAEGEVQYNYWACYEVRGQQRCEETDLTTFVAPEFAEDKKGRDLEKKIQTRQRFQRFLGTLIRGPTGVGKYYSDKINKEWEAACPKWKAEVDRWMENEWFHPEEWERLICRATLDEDFPDDVQIGFDIAGNVDVSKRLQVERETMPDGSTLYQFNWMLRASNTNIMYTVCANTIYCDSSCLVIEGTTDVAVQKGSTSSDYVPVYGPPDVEWAALCYKEEILDDDGEPSGEFGSLIAFAQPIVEENYVPGDAAEHSGYHAGGSSATTVPTGAGTFGNQTG
ncbi:MAG: hypothetical protein KAT43_02885 [Nanoarchaeota archaeon]|nr:hypothetical protein [Nanoarchaeota archaeon]